MLTTEALVAELKEDDKKGAAAGVQVARAVWAACTKLHQQAQNLNQPGRSRKRPPFFLWWARKILFLFPLRFPRQGIPNRPAQAAHAEGFCKTAIPF